MEPVRFGIVGAAGKRAKFFFRAAAAAPEYFRVLGAVVRDPAKGAEVEKSWGVLSYRTVGEMLKATEAEFVVVSVTRNHAPAVLAELAAKAVPALCETPPADQVDGLIKLHELVSKGAKIQVAEQYTFQPMHAARLALARGGKLGSVTQAQVSAAHGYHGVSLIRRMLGATFEDATIRGVRFTSPLVVAGGRSEPTQQETVKDSVQNIALLDFSGKLGVFDFTGDQYSSWIRSGRVLVRGDRGEINNTRLRYLLDHRTPIEAELLRADAGHDGNLEGYYHKGVLAGGEWVYRNPFAPARLSDDEIAVATCLAKMGQYARGGPEFYSLAEAAQDRYLDLMMTAAIETGEVVRTTRQVWASS